MPSNALPSFATRSPIFSLAFPRDNSRKGIYAPPNPLLESRPSSFTHERMKKSGLLAASVAAASATAVSASSSAQISHQDGMARRDRENSTSESSSSSEKFAPRFDGLRFIETLITAHR